VRALRASGPPFATRLGAGIGSDIREMTGFRLGLLRSCERPSLSDRLPAWPSQGLGRLDDRQRDERQDAAHGGLGGAEATVASGPCAIGTAVAPTSSNTRGSSSWRPIICAYGGYRARRGWFGP
jgi:hypothetical protein